MKYLNTYQIFESKKSDLSDKLDKLIIPFIKDKKVAGLNIGIFKDNKQILLNSYGFANLELEVKLNKDHVFEIASVTKQFTGACIMQLVEKKKLSLKDDITKWVKIDTHGRKVTVQNLLEHTSGLGFGIPDSKFETKIIKNGRSIPGDWHKKDLNLDTQFDKKNRNELVKLANECKPDFEPGEQQSYNNFGYFLLSLIVEKVSGKFFEDYLQENIFDIAGMRNSYAGVVDGIVKNKTTGYDWKNPNPDDKSITDENKILMKARSCNLNIPFGAGFISSTIEDLHKWNQALHGGKILGKEVYQEYVKVGELNDGEMTRYAKGITVNYFKSKKQYFHAGGIDGYNSMNWYLPEDKVSIIVLINTSPMIIPKFSDKHDTNLGEDLAGLSCKTVASLFFDVRDIEYDFDKEKVEFTGDLDEFVGTYKGLNDMTIQFIRKGKLLEMKFNKAKKNVPVYYIGSNSFSEGDFILKFVGDELHLNACGGYFKLKK